MPSITASRTLISASNFCDYVPGLSTISNGFELIYKRYHHISKSEWEQVGKIQEDFYHVHLANKSKPRSYFLLIPLISNIWIIVSDLIFKFYSWILLKRYERQLDENGEILSNKTEYAMSLLRRSADNGNMYALALLALPASEEEEEKASEDTFQVQKLIRAAAAGEKLALLHLGYYYYNGDLVEESKEKAAELYKLAANQGNADAQYSLGALYEKGEGIKKDIKKAIKFYELATQKGNIDALYALGKFHIQQGQDYLQKAFTSKDEMEKILGDCLIQEGQGYLRQASEKGNIDATVRLALLNVKIDELLDLAQIYYQNDLLEKDLKELLTHKLQKTFNLYAAAATKEGPGQAKASYYLGHFYLQGFVVEKDLKQAMEYYESAAQLGYTKAAYILGAHHEKKNKDRHTAIRFYTLAGQYADSPTALNRCQQFVNLSPLSLAAQLADVSDEED